MPPTLKINTDSASKDLMTDKCWNQHHLQKSETHLLKCRCSSALQGESLAVREAVGLAIARRWDKVDFETDSSNVANAVSSHMVNATWEIYPNR